MLTLLYMYTKDKILAIETSCDETGIAIIDAKSKKVLADSLYTQIEIHKEYGGVFPMLAKRAHGENILSIYNNAVLKTEDFLYIENDNDISLFLNIAEKYLNRETELLKQVKYLLTQKKFLKPNISHIAVTYGPGLAPALWVGISFAKFLATILNIPLIPTNHMEGHIYSVFSDKNIQTYIPALVLLISGGHTEFVDMKNIGDYKKIGKTRDDAIGEAYDKVARLLGLSYPGGPEISKRAQKKRQEKIHKNQNIYNIKLPRPMLNSNDNDFSFSGLKTAVLYLINDLKKIYGDNLSDDIKEEICYEFEESVKDVLTKKIKTLLQTNNFKTLIVGGGVISNDFLAENLKMICDENDILFLKPEKSLATDNAIMIALASIYSHKVIYPNTIEFEDLKAEGGLSF